jgi:hypothetical protein
MPKPRRAKAEPKVEPKPIAPVDLLNEEAEPDLPWEQRAQERKGWQTTLKIVIVQGAAGRGWIRHEFTVETCDLCRGGFSFFYPQYVPPGSWIEAEVEVKGQTVMIVGAVRDCYHVDGIRHRVGVQFNQIRRNAPKPG